jgi:hypothetical protein
VSATGVATGGWSLVCPVIIVVDGYVIGIGVFIPLGAIVRVIGLGIDVLVVGRILKRKVFVALIRVPDLAILIFKMWGGVIRCLRRRFDVRRFASATADGVGTIFEAPIGHGVFVGVFVVHVL